MKEDAITQAKKLIRAGSFNEAETVLKTALRETRDAGPALQELGNVFYLQQKFDAAASCYSKRLLLEPDNSTSNYSLALSLEALGRFDQALLHVRQARKANPSFRGAEELEQRLLAASSATRVPWQAAAEPTTLANPRGTEQPAGPVAAREAPASATADPGDLFIEGLPLLGNYVNTWLFLAALLAMGLVLAVFAGTGVPLMLVLLAAPIVFLFVWFDRMSTRIRILRRRIDLSLGLIWKKAFAVPIADIVKITRRQSATQKLANVMSIHLQLVGGKKLMIPSIAPLTRMEALYELLSAGLGAAARGADSSAAAATATATAPGPRATPAGARGPRDTTLMLPETREEFASYAERIREKERIDAAARLDAAAFTPGILGTLKAIFQVIVWIVTLGGIGFFLAAFSGLLK